MTWPGCLAMCRARRTWRGPPVPGCAVRPAWCHRGRAGRAGLRRAPGLVPPRTGWASPGRARSAVAWPECGRRCRRAPGGQGVARAEAAGARRVPGVRRAARARCPCRMPVPGFCGRGGHADSEGIFKLAETGPCSQPNRMETGARYEYRSLISRISQPTFAKMARSPNFMAQ